MNFPNVKESRVTLALFNACTVRGTVDDGNPVDVAVSKSGTVACRSHSHSRLEAEARTAVLKARLPTTMRRNVVSSLMKVN